MKGKILASLLLIILLLPSESKSLQDFSLPSLMDPAKRFSLSEFKGKLILLNFWTIGCPYCREELTILDKVQSLYPEDVKVIAVLYATPKEIKIVKAWIQQANIRNILVLLDSEGSIFNSYGVIAVPYTVVISRNGEKLTEFRGALPEEIIISIVEKSLK